MPLTRRVVLSAASYSAVGLAATVVGTPPCLAAAEIGPNEDDRLVARLIGRAATLSPLVHLDMPAVFGNGYSVPMKLSVDSPMTDAEHVRMVHVFAPKNPIIPVVTFAFTPQSGRAAIATRIRLAQPQVVLAVAEMNDGALLMARTWVEVATNGCN